MNVLPKKSWISTTPSSKKYLSRVFTYKLSSRLDPGKYEVAFEIPLSKSDDSEPDVVVFDRMDNGRSVMALEICKREDIHDMLIIARDLMEKSSLLDFFLYDNESGNWYNIRKAALGYHISSNTMFAGIPLHKLDRE